MLPIDISATQARSCCRLMAICITIGNATTDADRQRLADEADQLCRELGLPFVDRELLGKPFVPGETELRP